MDATKLINIKDKNQIKHLNFDKLMDDAIERGDAEGLKYLLKRAKVSEIRTSKKGKEFVVGASFLITRNEYLSKFLGWVPEQETAVPEKTFAEKQAERIAAIGKALKALEKEAAAK